MLGTQLAWAIKFFFRGKKRFDGVSKDDAEIKSLRTSCSAPMLHAGGRPMPRGKQSRVLQLIPCSQHMSEDVELPSKTAQILRH